MYKIEIFDTELNKWRDMQPIKGISDNRNLTYHQARSLAADYKGLSGTKHYRHAKQ